MSGHNCVSEGTIVDQAHDVPDFLLLWKGNLGGNCSSSLGTISWKTQLAAAKLLMIFLLDLAAASIVSSTFLAVASRGRGRNLTSGPEIISLFSFEIISIGPDLLIPSGREFLDLAPILSVS